MSIEAMKQALEALEYIDNNYMSLPASADKAVTSLRQAIAEAEKQELVDKKGSPCPEFWEWLPKAYNFDGDGNFTKYNMEVAFLAGKQSVISNDTHPPQRQQEPVAWKLVPIKPTEEMLKAMDECSTEGYDERLYAGHAASVYMAAVDVAPSPPQRQWVGLTDDEINSVAYNNHPLDGIRTFARAMETKLKEKNT